MAMSPEELQALSSRVASEVLQRIRQTLGGGPAAREAGFRCPGDFQCEGSYHCTVNFTTLTQAAE